jgi:hypothetical protein
MFPVDHGGGCVGHGAARGGLVGLYFMSSLLCSSLSNQPSNPKTPPLFET